MKKQHIIWPIDKFPEPIIRNTKTINYDGTVKQGCLNITKWGIIETKEKGEIQCL